MKTFDGIEVDTYLLRLAVPDDAPLIASYYQRNEDFLRPWEPVRSARFYTADYWRARVEINQVEFESGLAARMFLFPDSSRQAAAREVLASVNFFNFVRGAAHLCTLGFSIDSKMQGQGLMGRCLKAAISYAFSELTMHRIQANYMPHNLRSGRLLRRLGFEIEGYARDFLLIDGKWQDHILTSLVNPNWQSSPS